MSINFPDNAFFVYSVIIDISQFNILPTSEIERKLFSFSSTDSTTPYNDNFDQLDIFEIIQFFLTSQVSP